MTRKRSKRGVGPRPPAPDPEGIGTARQDPAVGSPDRLKLPHERDESPTDLAKRGERGVGQRELVEQAKDDLDHGLVDTDAARAGPPAPKVEPKKKPKKKPNKPRR